MCQISVFFCPEPCLGGLERTVILGPGVPTRGIPPKTNSWSRLWSKVVNATAIAWSHSATVSELFFRTTQDGDWRTIYNSCCNCSDQYPSERQWSHRFYMDGPKMEPFHIFPNIYKTTKYNYAIFCTVWGQRTLSMYASFFIILKSTILHYITWEF